MKLRICAGAFVSFMWFKDMHLIKRWGYISLTILVFLLLTACRPAQKPSKGIAALMPSLADAVDAFGSSGALIDHPLVAVSKYADAERYSGIRRLDSAGSLETLADMRPELVLLHSSDALLGEKLNRLGIYVIVHDMDTVDDIEATVRDIGLFLNKREVAVQINAQMRDKLAANRSVYRESRSNRPQALLVVDRLDARMQQFYVTRQPSYLADLFDGCGVDVIAVGDTPWGRMDAEALIRLNPEMIIFMARNEADSGAIRSVFSEIYTDLDAVKSRMLYIYADPDITVPGPDIGVKQERLCKDLQRFMDNR